MHTIKYLHCDKVNSKSATSEIRLLIFYCSECHFKNKLDLSFPKCLLQLLLNIHFKTCTQISYSQRFIGIGYVNLATKNRGHMALGTRKGRSKWALRTGSSGVRRV